MVRFLELLGRWKPGAAEQLKWAMSWPLETPRGGIARIVFLDSLFRSEWNAKKKNEKHEILQNSKTVKISEKKTLKTEQTKANWKWKNVIFFVSFLVVQLICCENLCRTTLSESSVIRRCSSAQVACCAFLRKNRPAVFFIDVCRCKVFFLSKK